MIVNLMASEVWSDADINMRVQAIIRYQVTQEDEMKAARLDRKPSKDSTDIAFIAGVDAVITSAVAEGRQARTDMTLLDQVLRLEQATIRLSSPVIEPELDDQGNVTNQVIIDVDTAVRTKYQDMIDTASTEVKSLFDLRNPVLETIGVSNEPI